MQKLLAAVKASPFSHAVAVLLTIIGMLSISIVIGPDGTKTVTIRKATATQTAQVKAAAVREANVTPSLGCDPAVGTGKMGSCAPHAAVAQASSLVAAVTRSTGYTSRYVGSRPIGVDVSSYQGCSINWGRLGVRFAFFKATEGTGYTDACLRHNVASAKAAHMPYGAYDFLRPGRSSATAEADHFVAAVRSAGANTSLPPVADVEANSGLSASAVGRYVCTWHQRVRALLHRSVSITYTGAWFWNPQTAGGNCGSLLWVSAYTFAPIVPRSWGHHTIWQYSDGIYGPAPHINRWDSDVFNGSLAQLHSLAGSKPRRITAADKHLCFRLNRWRSRHRPHRWLHAAQREKATLIAHGVVCLPGKHR